MKSVLLPASIKDFCTNVIIIIVIIRIIKFVFRYFNVIQYMELYLFASEIRIEIKCGKGKKGN